MLCFYHSADLDGHCAGASVKHFVPDVELIGINYGDEFPWGKVRGQQVYMVDFSLQPFDQMIRLKEEASRLIWIDHHKSAIEEWQKVGCPYINGIRRDGTGACALVWEYFDHVVPEAVRLLAEYDVWNHTDPCTLPFQWGLRMEETRPGINMDFWQYLFTLKKTQLMPWFEKGRLLLKYQAQENEKYIRAAAFETTLGGAPCIAVNKMLTNSQLFDSVWDATKYAMMITFGWRKGQWTVSLYSTREDVDCSAIAKKHGGGGHKGAAGFQCMSLPFDPELHPRYLL